MLQGVVQTVGRLRKYCGTCDFFNRDHKSVRPKQGCSFSLLIFLNLFIITITLLLVCVWERETGTGRQETMCGEGYWMAPAPVYVLSCVRVGTNQTHVIRLTLYGNKPCYPRSHLTGHLVVVSEARAATTIWKTFLYTHSKNKHFHLPSDFATVFNWPLKLYAHMPITANLLCWIWRQETEAWIHWEIPTLKGGAGGTAFKKKKQQHPLWLIQRPMSDWSANNR